MLFFLRFFPYFLNISLAVSQIFCANILAGPAGKQGEKVAGTRLITILFSSIFCLGAIPQASAQEGHPMSGSWVGDWGIGNNARNRVVIILEWTGSELTGTLNPGANAIPVTSAVVDPADWSLHMVAQGQDARGRAVTYTIDGTLDDLGTYNRTLAGTWQVGSQSGDFSITRQ
jgi:hypothetical protein